MSSQPVAPAGRNRAVHRSRTASGCTARPMCGRSGSPLWIPRGTGPAPPSSARRRTPGSRPDAARTHRAPRHRHASGGRPTAPRPPDVRHEPRADTSSRATCSVIGPDRGGPLPGAPARGGGDRADSGGEPRRTPAVAAPPAPGTGPARRAALRRDRRGRRRRARHADHPTDPAGRVGAGGRRARARPRPHPRPRRPGAGCGCSSPRCWCRARWPRWSGVVLLWPTGGLPPTTAARRSSRCRPRSPRTQRRPTAAPATGDGAALRRRAGPDGRRAATRPGPGADRAGRAGLAAVRGRRPGGARLVRRRPDRSRVLPDRRLPAGAAAALAGRGRSPPRCCCSGRWRGLAALAALGLSFVVLLVFVLPAILAGQRSAGGGRGRLRPDHVRGALPDPRAVGAHLDRGAGHPAVAGADRRCSGARVLGGGPAHRARRPDRAT